MTPNVWLLVEFLTVQLEHGRVNGELNATHRALERFGIPYGVIKATINEAVESALIEITSPKHAHTTTFRLIEWRGKRRSAPRLASRC